MLLRQINSAQLIHNSKSVEIMHDCLVNVSTLKESEINGDAKLINLVGSRLLAALHHKPFEIFQTGEHEAHVSMQQFE